MKALKMIQTAIAVIVISVLAGCSDQLISPTASNDTNNSVEINSAGNQAANNVFHSKIGLKPYQSYSFDYLNTGFFTFNSIWVADKEVKSKLEIFGYLDDEVIVLNEESKGFFVRTISIQNVTSKALEIDVTLSGSRVKYPEQKSNKTTSD